MVSASLSTSVYVAFIGLIWGIGNIVRITLSESHPKLALVVGRDLQACAMFIILAISTGIFFPLYVVQIMTAVVTVACLAYLYYMHFHKPRKVRRLKRQEPKQEDLRWSNRVVFVLSCISVIVSVYTLYWVGWRTGDFDGLTWVSQKVPGLIGNLHYPSGLFTQTATGIAQLILGMIGFTMLSAYALIDHRTIQKVPKVRVSRRSVSR